MWINCDMRVSRNMESTHARIPPSGAETNGRIPHWCLLIVTFAIASVNTRWNHGVSKSKSSSLKNMSNTRMDILFVALIRRQSRAEERWQIFVDYHILKTSDHRMPRPLKNVFVAPGGIQ